MIRLRIRPLGVEPPTGSARRRPFGLETPLPADRRIVERALLRHLAEERPSLVVLALTGRKISGEAGAKSASAVSIAIGIPDLLLLAPGGRLAFIKIKTQAEQLSREHRAFSDLCRELAIPLLVVRSLPEARRALDRLAL